MGSAVTIALPTMQESLDTTIEGVQWIVNVYALALGSLILLSGALGDVLGLRRTFNSGIVLFTIGNLLCAIAPALWFLLLGRAVTGVGAAFMIPGSLAVINSSFRSQERGTVIGLWAGVSGAIAALGPLFGGVLASVSWRLVYAGVIPIGIATLIVSMRVIPRSADRGDRRLDLLGAVLVFLSLAGVTFALVRAPNRGFGRMETAATALGLIALGGFLYHESRSSSPLVPVEMFTRKVTGANIVTVLLYFTLQGALFLLSFTLQQLRGLSATRAGLALLPTTLVIAGLSGASGRITDRYGPRLQVILGPLVVCAACALLSTADVSRGYIFAFLPGIVLLGLGMVITIPGVTRSALDVADSYSGAASGVNNAASRVAGLLAVAIVGGVLAAVFGSGLASQLGQTGMREGAIEAIVRNSSRLLALEIPANVPGQAQQEARAILRHSYIEGYRIATLVCSGSAALAAVAGAVFIHPADRKNEQTAH
jgi:EmrB/QacA subfamily drug resistance transporter